MLLNSLHFVSQEMTAFLDGCGDAGFIYISFGSYAQISRLPLESQQIIYDVLKSFSKIRFIWKWEGVRPLEMPDNVFTAKWIPQQALLGKDTQVSYIIVII